MRLLASDYMKSLLAISLMIAIVHIAFGLKLRLDPAPDPERVQAARLHPVTEQVEEP